MEQPPASVHYVDHPRDAHTAAPGESSSSSSFLSSFLAAYSSSSQLLFIVSVFCVIATSVVIPLGLVKSATARRLVGEVNERRFTELRQHQSRLMKAVMAAQLSIATLEAHVDHAAAALAEAEAAVASEAETAKSERDSLVQQIEALRNDLDGQLRMLAKETQHSLNAALRNKLNAQKRFIVKWHAGAKGVQCSEHYATEQEANTKYSLVGEVAKKLLMFDERAASGGAPSGRGRWVVRRRTGGDNWLSCMTDDDDPNVGACRTGG